MDFVKEIVDELSTWLDVRYVVAAVAALVALWFLWAIYSRKRNAPPIELPNELLFDYRSLGEKGPPPGPLRLEFMSIPIRLAAVVLAPSGRGSDLPPDELLPMVLSRTVPGLDRVLKLHEPLIRPWPRQLSENGFTQAFFAKVKLPGDFGAGTPWCSVAGKFKYRGIALMVGLVLRAEDDNDYGQRRVERPEAWRDCLRVSGLG